MTKFPFWMINFLIIIITPCCIIANGKGDKITLKYEPKISGEIYTFSIQSEGNYYLYENWIEGDIKLITGETVEGKRLKYNRYLDELIWLSSTTFKQVQADKNLVDEFIIQIPGMTKPSVFRRITIYVPFETDSVNLFAQILYEGNLTLVSHRRVIKTDERHVSVDGSIGAIPILTSDPKFFIIMNDNQVYEINRLRRRSLYQIFPEHRGEIRSVLRNENLIIRSENDFTLAISLIDKIFSQE